MSNVHPFFQTGPTPFRNTTPRTPYITISISLRVCVCPVLCVSLVPLLDCVLHHTLEKHPRREKNGESATLTDEARADTTDNQHDQSTTL